MYNRYVMSMKLFITDYDGTLFIDEDSLKENIKYLKELQKNNFSVVISTGRSYPSIKSLIDNYGIPYDYLSCADGSIIYDRDGNILEMYEMSHDILDSIINFYQTINYDEIQFSYPTGYSNIFNTNDTLLGINICISTPNYNDDIVNKFLSIKNSFPNYNYLTYRHPIFSYLCIKPNNISKSATIRYLKDKYNIDNHDIYVIGDSDNDYAMIKDFNGSCMESATIEILDIAKNKYKNVSDFIKDILN